MSSYLSQIVNTATLLPVILNTIVAASMQTTACTSSLVAAAMLLNMRVPQSVCQVAGRPPRSGLLQQYRLEQYTAVVTALQTGSIGVLNDALVANQYRFIMEVVAPQLPAPVQLPGVLMLQVLTRSGAMLDDAEGLGFARRVMLEMSDETISPCPRRFCRKPENRVATL